MIHDHDSGRYLVGGRQARDLGAAAQAHFSIVVVHGHPRRQLPLPEGLLSVRYLRGQAGPMPATGLNQPMPCPQLAAL
jgi:hypothetical protein